MRKYLGFWSIICGVLDALTASPWPGPVLCALVYALSYALGLNAARLYLAGSDEHITFEGGFPGTREYQATWARGRPGSLRFGLSLALVVAAVSAAWYACVRVLARPPLYQAAVGGVMLFELVSALESLRRATLLGQALRQGLDGHVTYSRRAVGTLQYEQLYAFALLFGLFFALTGSWFFVGGALACLVAAQRSRDWVILRT